MSYKTTLLPDYIDIVQCASINYYNTSTTLLCAFSNYVSELKLSVDFEQSKTKPDTLAQYGRLFSLLNSTNFVIPEIDVNGSVLSEKELDNTFKLFFIEKYQSLGETYKQIVSSFIPNNVLFTTFSDDVGMVGDVTCILDNNVAPYTDTFSQDYFLPNNIPTSLVNKITKNELAVLKTFSLKGDALLKNNLTGLLNNVDVDTAKTAHGKNLITDIQYYRRMYVIQYDILDKIQLVIGNLYEFISFFKQLNPRDLDPERKAFFYKYTITNMENLAKNVDVLKNDLNVVKNSISQVLKV